jgi:hypothetical protein
MGNNYKIFVDLDGVLVDFDQGVKSIFGKGPDELSPGVMWGRLAKTPDFYDQLYWLEGGKELWKYVSQHNPIIMTGLPLGKWAEPQKRSWCCRELGEAVEVICCMSKQKGLKVKEVIQEGEVPVLIDDRISAKEAWEAVGGIFIHHTNVDNSI